MATTKIDADLTDLEITFEGKFDDDATRQVAFKYTGSDGVEYQAKAMQKRVGGMIRLMCPACGAWAAALQATPRGLRCKACAGKCTGDLEDLTA